MNRQEFFACMEGYASDRGQVVVKTINKPTGDYTGLYIKAEAGAPTPVANLDLLYSDYLEGTPITDCYDNLDKMLDSSREMPFDVKRLVEWEYVKDRLFLRLSKDPSDGVSRKAADLFVCPYIQLSSDGFMVTKVIPGLVESWGVDVEEVFAQATANAEIIRPAKIFSLAEELGIPVDMAPGLYGVSNKMCHLGASAILYPGVAESVRDKLGGDFYILPSSIHEVIVVPREGDAKDFAKMVYSVNAAEVAPEEQLSNRVYVYNFDTHTIEAVA